jgi:RNA polymerase sigma factor (sigma-70 family)
MPTSAPTLAAATARPPSCPAAPKALPSDATLLGAARLGDADAVAELYSRHLATVTRVARRHACPDFPAQDLVSEAFAKLLRALANGRGPDDNALAYLIVSVRNLSAGHARRAGHRHAPAVAPDEALHAIPDSRPGLDERLLTAELQHHVRVALDSLQPSWREAILLMYVEELSVADASQRLGITPEAFRALSYRARRALRAAYLAASPTH